MANVPDAYPAVRRLPEYRRRSRKMLAVASRRNTRTVLRSEPAAALRGLSKHFAASGARLRRSFFETPGLRKNNTFRELQDAPECYRRSFYRNGAIVRTLGDIFHRWCRRHASQRSPARRFRYEC